MSGGFLERTPVAGTARSGLSTKSGAFMDMQNSPLGQQPESRTGVLAGDHPSGYHPSWESGYGITEGSATPDGKWRGTFKNAKGRLDMLSGYKPPEMEFGNLDKQALEDVAGLATPERQPAKALSAPGIGYARGQGGNVPLSKGYEHTYAPNPGAALFVPRREKDRFAGR